MRTNLPVNNTEYVLKDWETIVSKTDLKGSITYANSDFIRISGFDESELIGAPQNILRHPDMPAEAFADLWVTIKSGKAWTGLVKNRCKDGSYYWVDATAAPIITDGAVTGYVSIRVKPNRTDVEAAARAYELMKGGKSRLSVRDGRIIPMSLLRIEQVPAVSMNMTFTLASVFIVLLFLLTVLISFQSDPFAASAQVAIALTGIIVTIGLIIMIRQRVIAPLIALRHEVQRMSSGNLSKKIQVAGDDEISSVAHGLRVLQTNVRLLVGQIQEVTGIVRIGATEITQGTADLSARTESQASSLEETAASMEELTCTVKQNAANANDVNQMMARASSESTASGTAMREVIATMLSIHDSSRRIVDIIGVIDGIAFQTNILALNAAVEAARAGEQGRGFAVVASEVRNLAQRASAAAKEIKTLIDDTVQKVEDGSRLVENAGVTMDSLVGNIGEVAMRMNDISNASHEQGDGIAQINQAVVQMDEVTQQNAALVEEATAAAEELQHQATRLAGLVNSFTLVAAHVKPEATDGKGRRK